MAKQRGSKPAKNRARSSNPRIATALARSRLNVHVIDGSWANERNGDLERLKYDREMLVDFIGTMRVCWIGVFVCILSCLVIIIYLYKKNADYRTHDKWQFLDVINVASEQWHATVEIVGPETKLLTVDV